jgi:hypothetical protein
MNTSYKYEPYFQFIEAFHLLKKSPQFSELDHLETELLNCISLHWHQGKPLLVKEAISLENSGSRATLHARIKNLRQKGYIDFHSDIDGRKKVIKPTILAMSFFASVSNLLTSIVEQNVVFSSPKTKENRTHAASSAILVG